MTNRIVLCLLLVAACTASALAATDVAYVAFNGNDANPCSRTSPCKTITHSLGAVTPGGVVDIIASGSYDRFLVTGSVTVKADPGVVATIDVAASGTGVTVTAGSSDLVTLRNLRLHGNGATGVGFQINSVGRISVEDCVSRNFAYGLSFVPAAGGDLKINGGTFDGGNTGLYLVAPSAHVAIDRATIYGEGSGGSVSSNSGAINTSTAITTVTNSLITRGPGSLAQNGIVVNGGTAVLENDVISMFADGAGLQVFATAYLSGCTMSGNFFDVGVTGGVAFTRGNNTLLDTVDTLTPFSAT